MSAYHILIVEDDTDTRSLLQTFLCRYLPGVNIDVATAMDLVAGQLTQRFDLLIWCCPLPAVPSTKGNAFVPSRDIPALMITSETRLTMPEASSFSGLDVKGILYKPFMLSDLLEHIKTLKRNRRRPQTY